MIAGGNAALRNPLRLAEQSRTGRIALRTFEARRSGSIVARVIRCGLSLMSPSGEEALCEALSPPRVGRILMIFK